MTILGGTELFVQDEIGICCVKGSRGVTGVDKSQQIWCVSAALFGACVPAGLLRVCGIVYFACACVLISCVCACLFRVCVRACFACACVFISSVCACLMHSCVCGVLFLFYCANPPPHPIPFRSFTLVCMYT